MVTRPIRRMAWVPAVIVVPALGILAAHTLQHSLERRARELDPQEILRTSGLAGRVMSIRWEASRIGWWPRPALVLRGVEAQLSSGLPGPGAVSGRLRLNTVRLVPGWQYLRTHSPVRIEASGGLLEIGSDLVPALPSSFLDPIDGANRPVPWDAILAVAADTVGTRGHSIPPVPPSDTFGRENPAIPVVTLDKLQIRTAAMDALPGTVLRFDEGRLVLTGTRMEMMGRLEISRPGRPDLAVPVRVGRRTDPETGVAIWMAKAGSESGGMQLRIVSGPGGREPGWSADLEDTAGKLADAVLEGRAGALGRLRWSGACRIHAEGTGRFPNGLTDARIDLLRGEILLEGPTSVVLATASGRLRVKPGYVDLPDLVLRRGDDPADSAVVRFGWVRTMTGRRVQGSIDGRLDPGWLALAGPEWIATGRVTCRVGFEAAVDDASREWHLTSHGSLQADLDSLSGPWFAGVLRAGRLEAWIEQGRLQVILAGRWGESPFRLEARGLPPPMPGYLDRVYTDSWWTFRSPWCRLEDFRLSQESFSRSGPFPFWLGFPGRGSVHIERGTFEGIAFDSLEAVTSRSRRGMSLDSLSVGLAGGKLRTSPGWHEPGISDSRVDFDTRVQGEDLDAAEAQKLLGNLGLRIRGELRGTLGGELRVRRFPARPEAADHITVDGTVHLGSGSLRGLPVQESLCRSTHLDALSLLSFSDGVLDFRKDENGFFWNRMRLDAAPMRLEGAGRIYPDDTVRAAIVVRLLGGAEGDPLTGTLRALAGEANSSVYTVVGGAAEAPTLEMVSRAEFLREMDRLGGALPLTRP